MNSQNFYADLDGSNNKLHGSLKFLHGSVRVDKGFVMIWYGAITISDELIKIFKNFLGINMDR